MTHLVVVNVQPHLTQHDYKSAKRLTDKLVTTIEKYKEEIDSSTKDGDEILLVFPETIGTWLVASQELFILFWMPTILIAMILLILFHPFMFLTYFLESYRNNMQQFETMELVKRSVFRMKAKQMHQDYVDVFSTIARRYRAYVVAGSTFLPKVKDGRVTADGVYNVSLSFDPFGNICHETHKCNLIPEERKFLDAAKPEEEIKVFRTSWGNIGVFICADSWIPKMYSKLEPLKPDLIAVPAMISPAHEWHEPWQGYSVATMDYDPYLYDKADVKLKQESEMWLKYAVAGRMSEAGAFVGVTSFMRGKIWDMTMGGQSLVKVDNVLYQIASFAKEQQAIVLRISSRRK